MTLALQHTPTASIADTLSVVDAVLGALDRRIPAHVSREDLASAGQLALVDNDATCPARSAETLDTYASLQAALDLLPVNHARVLRRYYLQDATLEEIASELGISKERVRQIREAAEKKLREDFVVLALWQSVLSRR